MSDILNISQCNLAQTVGETNRFLFHVMLVHFATCIIEGKKAFFGEELFRTLLITAMAIAMYHVFFRKIIEPKVEKMKLICLDGKDRISKKKEISKQYHSEKEQTRIKNESRDETSEKSEESETFTVSEYPRDHKRKHRTDKKKDSKQESKQKRSKRLSSDGNTSNKVRAISSKGGNTPGNYSKRQQILRD